MSPVCSIISRQARNVPAQIHSFSWLSAGDLPVAASAHVGRPMSESSVACSCKIKQLRRVDLSLSSSLSASILYLGLAMKVNSLPGGP
jgi:hypothetical protein